MAFLGESFRVEDVSLGFRDLGFGFRAGIRDSVSKSVPIPVTSSQA